MNKIVLIIATAFNVLSMSAMVNPKIIASAKFDRRKQAETFEQKKVSFSVINRVRKLEQSNTNKISRRDKEFITRDEARSMLQELYCYDHEEGINESFLN